MHRSELMRLALGLGVLVVMALALTGCSSGSSQEEQEAKARPLPEQPQELRPGEYRSEEFEPSVSFGVDKGWSTLYPEDPDFFMLGWEEKEAGLAFTNVRKVYEPIHEPTETSKPKMVEAPEDLVGWFQDHPHLKTSKPKPVTVGGVKGQQFDVFAEEVPEEHLSMCGAGCVDALNGITSDKFAGPLVVYFEGDKWQAIVLEDVKGETVYIDYGGPVPDFDEIAPQARKVLESVQWTGS